MKIETVYAPLDANEPDEHDGPLMSVVISGPIDSENPTLARAREMVLKTGSKTMIESFDWAVGNGVILSEK